MFNYHNEPKVDNYPKVNDAVVKPTEVQQKQPSFKDDVMSGHRKTPTNMDNNYHPNKKANVDYDAKVNTLDHTATTTTATSIKVAAAALSTSISLDEETNGRGFSVNDHDVLCGRGKGKPHSHVGSVNYRRLVSANKEFYILCHERDKKKISRGIVTAVRLIGGRFLRYDERNDIIYPDIGDKKAMEKTSQTLRDALNRSKSKNALSRNVGKEDMSVPVTIDTTIIDWTKELPQEWYTSFSSQKLKSFNGNGRHPFDSSVTKKPAMTVNASQRKHEIASFLVTMPQRLTSDESYLNRPIPSIANADSCQNNDRTDSNLSRSSESSALSGLSHTGLSFAYENLSRVSQRLSPAPAEGSQVQSFPNK